MLSRGLVLIGITICICALALTACKKKDEKKPSDDEAMSAAVSMEAAMTDGMDDGMKDESMAGESMAGDAMAGAPTGKIDATKVAERVLTMQKFLSDRLVNSLPDCDKGVESANAMLDEKEWTELMATVKANRDAVKAAQGTLLAADRSKGAFIRGRIKFMAACKGNKKYEAFAQRLGTMWK